MAGNATTNLNLTRIGRIAVSVSDTDRALDFYIGTLGFEKAVDVPMGSEGMRWVEVKLPGTETNIALAPPPPGKQAGGQDGIILDTPDIEAAHAALKDTGADVDAEISRMGAPVPPMFWIRDPDGNSLIIVEPNER